MRGIPDIRYKRVNLHHETSYDGYIFGAGIKCPVYCAKDQGFKRQPITLHVLTLQLFIFSAAHYTLTTVDFWHQRVKMYLNKSYGRI